MLGVGWKGTVRDGPKGKLTDHQALTHIPLLSTVSGTFSAFFPPRESPQSLILGISIHKCEVAASFAQWTVLCSPSSHVCYVRSHGIVSIENWGRARDKGTRDMSPELRSCHLWKDSLLMLVHFIHF